MTAQVRVAIADDNLEFCHLLADYFQNCPKLKLVGVAHEGVRALKLVKETPVDVLLLDMVMPNIDGLGVLERLHDTELAHRPKVIVFTAFGQEEMTRKAVSYGANYYIVKPFDLATLVKRICEIAGEREGRILRLHSAEEVERRVAKIIHHLRIPADFKGHAYLREAVMMSLEDATLITEVTKRLYPRIAEKYYTTSERVERAMRFAIETAWNRGDIEYLHSIFGYGVDKGKGKPTNASFIAKVADRVRLELLAKKVSNRA
ncbi:MAG: sporulation transcription factor Spo0A [Patescibacteria group bacterium]